MYLLGIAAGTQALEILHGVRPAQPLGHNVIAVGLFGIRADPAAGPALPVVPEQHLQPEALPGFAAIASPEGADPRGPLSAPRGLEERESLWHWIRTSWE